MILTQRHKANRSQKLCLISNPYFLLPNPYFLAVMGGVANFPTAPEAAEEESAEEPDTEDQQENPEEKSDKAESARVDHPVIIVGRRHIKCWVKGHPVPGAIAVAQTVATPEPATVAINRVGTAAIDKGVTTPIVRAAT